MQSTAPSPSSLHFKCFSHREQDPSTSGDAILLRKLRERVARLIHSLVDEFDQYDDSSFFAMGLGTVNKLDVLMLQLATLPFVTDAGGRISQVTRSSIDSECWNRIRIEAMPKRRYNSWCRSVGVAK